MFKLDGQGNIPIIFVPSIFYSISFFVLVRSSREFVDFRNIFQNILLI